MRCIGLLNAQQNELVEIKALCSIDLGGIIRNEGCYFIDGDDFDIDYIACQRDEDFDSLVELLEPTMDLYLDYYPYVPEGC